MRVVLAIAIWVVILGGLAAYFATRHAVQPAAVQQQQLAPLPGEFYVELMPTYDVPAKDDFALVAIDPVTLSLNSHEIYVHTQPAAAGQTIEVRWYLEQVPLIAGKNEFYVVAAPPGGAFKSAPGIRLRLMRDGAVQDEQTIWGEPQRKVQGPVPLNYSNFQEQQDFHDH